MTTPSVRIISDLTLRPEDAAPTTDFVANAALNEAETHLTITTPIAVCAQVVPPRCRKPRCCYFDGRVEIDLAINSDDLTLAAEWETTDIYRLDNNDPRVKNGAVTERLWADSTGQLFHEYPRLRAPQPARETPLETWINGTADRTPSEWATTQPTARQGSTLDGRFFGTVHIPAYLDNGFDNPLTMHFGIFSGRNASMSFRLPDDALRRYSNDYRTVGPYNKEQRSGIPAVADLEALGQTVVDSLSLAADAVRFQHGIYVTACHAPQYDFAADDLFLLHKIKPQSTPEWLRGETYTTQPRNQGVSLADPTLIAAMGVVNRSYFNIRIHQPDMLPGSTFDQALSAANSCYEQLRNDLHNLLDNPVAATKEKSEQEDHDLPNRHSALGVVNYDWVVRFENRTVLLRESARTIERLLAAQNDAAHGISTSAAA